MVSSNYKVIGGNPVFEQKVRNKKLQSFLLEVLSCGEVRKLERLDDDLCRKLRNSIDQLEEEGERALSRTIR